MDLFNQLLVVSSFLLLASIVASKISGKMGVPTLLFFLLIGTLAGTFMPDVFPWNPETAQKIGTVTLTLILFSGGLETHFDHVRPVLGSGILLSTLGAFITTMVLGFFLHWLRPEFALMSCLLVGAILASTDAAAVFSILRSRNIKLKANLGPLLELESGSNDVMVYFLMEFFSKRISHPEADGDLAAVIPVFFREMVIGALGGVLMGYLTVQIINRINLSYPALYPTLSLSLVIMNYALTRELGGSGFLAIYIAGMILGNRDFLHKKSLLRFYEGLGWLMQIIMFIALGVLIQKNTLAAHIGIGLALAVIMMFLARPLSVFLSLAFSGFTAPQKLFLSWGGLRGAVPIVFATYLYQEETKGDALDAAHVLFHLIVCVVIVSVLCQGTTLYPLAKWLRLENKLDVLTIRQEKQIEQRADIIKSQLIQLEVPAGSPVINKQIVALGLPDTIYIAVIQRGKQYLRPRGDTRIQEEDRLVVMVDTKKEIKEIKACLGLPAS